MKQSIRKPNMPSFFPCHFCLPFWMCFLPQPNPDILATEVLQWLLQESSGSHAFLLVPASVTDLVELSSPLPSGLQWPFCSLLHVHRTHSFSSILSLCSHVFPIPTKKSSYCHILDPVFFPTKLCPCVNKLNNKYVCVPGFSHLAPLSWLTFLSNSRSTKVLLILSSLC